MVRMTILKNSKFIRYSVLGFCLLAGCDDVTTTQFSLSNLEKNFHHVDPAQANSMWATMSRNFALGDSSERDLAERPEVKRQIAIFQRNSDKLYKVLEDAAPYISYVYREIEKRELPAELALLPVLESDFKPHAKSRAGAMGLWQIMPDTANKLGLKRNQAYDGRKDVVASTNAALNYLTYLRQSFKNDWFIALGAYNWGPGNIQRAIKGYKRADYWTLNMPKETKVYVPKLLALAAIVQNPERYNVKLPPMDTKPSVAMVQARDKVDLKKVAESSGIDVDTMKALNPGYHGMETTKHTPNALLVPIDKKRDVLKALYQAADPKVLLAANEDTSTNLLKAILKGSKWVIVALADVPIESAS